MSFQNPARAGGDPPVLLPSLVSRCFLSFRTMRELMRILDSLWVSQCRIHPGRQRCARVYFSLECRGVGRVYIVTENSTGHGRRRGADRIRGARWA